VPTFSQNPGFPKLATDGAGERLPFSLTHVPFQIEKDWYKIAFFSSDLAESHWKFDADSESEGIL